MATLQALVKILVKNLKYHRDRVLVIDYANQLLMAINNQIQAPRIPYRGVEPLVRNSMGKIRSWVEEHILAGRFVEGLYLAPVADKNYTSTYQITQPPTILHGFEDQQLSGNGEGHHIQNKPVQTESAHHCGRQVREAKANGTYATFVEKLLSYFITFKAQLKG